MNKRYHKLVLFNSNLLIITTNHKMYIIFMVTVLETIIKFYIMQFMVIIIHNKIFHNHRNINNTTIMILNSLSDPRIWNYMKIVRFVKSNNNSFMKQWIIKKYKKIWKEIPKIKLLKCKKIKNKKFKKEIK